MTTFIFGEAMLEYHSHGGSGLRYGGDTLNTAIHLARAGHEVAFVTAVGTDPISDALVDAWSSEGIDTSHVLRHPDRHPGIYAIHLDERGERSFLYWRDQSAAKQMFDLRGIEGALIEAAKAKLIYFSLISLAIIDANGRDKLLALAAQRKAYDKAVAYDSNFRPALWKEQLQARSVSRAAMGCCTIGLPTNSDERDLWATSENEKDIASRWIAAGCELVAVKAAERGCALATRDQQTPQILEAKVTEVIDSSGAGDAFNGGFIDAWLKDKSIETCVEEGQSLARRTLAHQGAISLNSQ